MVTIIQQKIDNKKVKTIYRTQQYKIGTYLIINDDPSKQIGLSINEKKFHKKLRENVIENKDKILKGSSIVNLKSHQDINKFEENE